MEEISCSLLSEGRSDAALVPVLHWLAKEHCPSRSVQVEWADLSRLPRTPCDLADKIVATIEYFPCDILFIHRDADRETPETRSGEIAAAMERAVQNGVCVPYVCVIPVREQEAWLLLDETAIRRAAGNPNGRMPLAIPPPGRIESIPDPKGVLHNLLKNASGLRSRRLKKFHPGRSARRVTECMTDFACLRALRKGHYSFQEAGLMGS